MLVNHAFAPLAIVLGMLSASFVGVLATGAYMHSFAVYDSGIDSSMPSSVRCQQCGHHAFITMSNDYKCYQCGHVTPK